MRTHEKTVAGKTICLAVFIISTATLGACMSPMARTHSYQDGWRHVEYVGLAAGANSNVQVDIDCRKDAVPMQEESKRTFILLKDNQRSLMFGKENKNNPKWIHNTRYWIVAVDDAQRVKIGDTLFANSMDC
mgnify:CR=1 FL=1